MQSNLTKTKCYINIIVISRVQMCIYSFMRPIELKWQWKMSLVFITSFWMCSVIFQKVDEIDYLIFFEILYSLLSWQPSGRNLLLQLVELFWFMSLYCPISHYLNCIYALSLSLSSTWRIHLISIVLVSGVRYKCF